MDGGKTILLTVKLLDHRVCENERFQIAELAIPVFKGSGWHIKVQDLLASIQSSPSRIEEPFKVYFRGEQHRQCILSLDENGHEVSSEGTLPVSDNWTIWLDIEDYRTGPKPESPPSNSSDSPERLTIEEAYDRAASILKSMPPDCLPGVPRWTAEELAAHDFQLSRLTDDELSKLETLRFQESRRLEWPETPINFELEYGTGKRLPNRPIRPWETRRTGRIIPEWLQHRQLKKNRKVGQWDPSVKPIYPTFVFAASKWDIPDNSKYTRHEVNQSVVSYLKSLLIEKPGYWEFVESKGRCLPLLDLLRQCFFARNMLSELTKIRCPIILPICGGSIVTKENVLRALDRKPSWGSDCLETLALAELYGPLGQREDKAIVDAIDTDSDHPMGSVKFLELLRNVDEAWQRTHPSSTVTEQSELQ